MALYHPLVVLSPGLPQPEEVPLTTGGSSSLLPYLLRSALASALDNAVHLVLILRSQKQRGMLSLDNVTAHDHVRMTASTLLAAIKSVTKVNDREALLEYLDTVIDLVRGAAPASHPAEQMAVELQHLRTEYTPARYASHCMSTPSDKSGPEDFLHTIQRQQQARIPFPVESEQLGARVDSVLPPSVLIAGNQGNGKLREGNLPKPAGVAHISASSASLFDRDEPLSSSLDLSGTWSGLDCLPETNRANVLDKAPSLWNNLSSAGTEFDIIQSEFSASSGKMYANMFDIDTTEGRGSWAIPNSVFA